jgi:hypothetical protein
MKQKLVSTLSIFLMPIQSDSYYVGYYAGMIVRSKHRDSHIVNG